MIWLRTHLNIIAVAAVGFVILLLVALVAWNTWEARQTAKVESALTKGQTEAAIASGRAAVEIVGNNTDTVAAIDKQTRTNEDDIRAVPGASASVAPADRDAFLRILCRKPGRSSDPKCVQFASPK